VATNAACKITNLINTCQSRNGPFACIMTARPLLPESFSNCFLIQKVLLLRVPQDNGANYGNKIKLRKGFCSGNTTS
jgi:hypothetical protein